MESNNNVVNRLLILSFVLLSATFCQGQTFDEWFRQKKTQKKYLLQQIAALRIYLGYVQKGYTIAKEGLTAINEAKHGQFSLHQDYFSRLKSINPKISGYAKVADILTLQQEISKICKTITEKLRSQTGVTKEEKNYIEAVIQNILKDRNAIIMDFVAVITPKDLQMKDDERVSRLDAIYNRLQENYAFAREFGLEAVLLVILRKKEESEIQAGRTLNDIKKNKR